MVKDLAAELRQGARLGDDRRRPAAGGRLKTVLGLGRRPRSASSRRRQLQGPLLKILTPIA